MSYTIVDNEIYDIEDLKPTQKLLLLTLVRYFNEDDGYAYPSQVTLMKKVGLKDKNTLIKAINELEEKGYIRRSVGKGTNNRYFITSIKNPTSSENATSMENPTTPVRKTQLHQYEKPDTINTNTNTKKNTNNKKKNIYKDLSFIDLSLVKVTEEEYTKLIELVKGDTELIHDKMLSLEVGIANKKKKYLGYKNHYLTLRQWINKDNKKTPTAIGAENKNIKVNPSICNNRRKYTQSCDIG